MTDPTIQQQPYSISKPIDIRANEAIDGKVNDLGLMLEGCYFTVVYLILVPDCFCSVCRIHGLRTMATSCQELEQDGPSAALHQIT